MRRRTGIFGRRPVPQPAKQIVWQRRPAQADQSIAEQPEVAEARPETQTEQHSACEEPQHKAPSRGKSLIATAYANIPDLYRRLRRWVLFRIEPDRNNPERETKVPYQPNGSLALSNKPATWSSFDAVLTAVAKGGFDGIGFCRADDFVFVDWDGCLDSDGNWIRFPEFDDEFQPEAICNRLEAFGYTERSVSGTGMHGIYRCLEPPKGIQLDLAGEHRGAAIYSQLPRYFTVSGQQRFVGDLSSDASRPLARYSANIHAVRDRIRDAKREAKRHTIVNGYTPPAAAPPPPPRTSRAGVRSDSDVFNDCMNDPAFRAALEGSAFDNDHSRMDDNALQRIFFWSGGPDREQADRVFRMTSLYREKWERDDYRERTLDHALSLCSSFYDPEFYKRGRRQPGKTSTNGVNGSVAGSTLSDDPADQDVPAGRPRSSENTAHADPDQPGAAPDDNPSDAEAPPPRHGGRRSHHVGDEGSPIGVPSWPAPMAEEAFYGLAGDMVRLIEPQCESDPAALLGQFLVAFGNLTRGPHYRVGRTTHFTNDYVAIVGDTSKSRKGTSWDWTRDMLAQADPNWSKEAIAAGASTGEGLIEKLKKQEKQEDDIKRLLLVESELARVLAAMEREGNTLSMVMRQGWDTDHLETIVKTNAQDVSGAHLSIVGHITLEELRRKLTTTEAANGLGNRFMWLCAKRSRLLPDGGFLSDGDMQPLVRRLRDAIEFVRKAGFTELKRDENAKALWHEVYEGLSEGGFGLFGALTNRAEAHVLRLSCIYALLDKSVIIRVEHLRAALASWKYAKDSALLIWSDSIGDPIADEILALLRRSPEGLTRNEIINLFSRHNTAKVAVALTTLAKSGRARFVKEETSGRPAERWFAL